MNKIQKIQFRSDFEETGFELKTLEELMSHKMPIDHNPFKPHRLNFFALLFITSGKVNHIVDFKEQHLTINDCLVISKGQVHAFDKNNTYKGYLILFTEDFLIKNLSKTVIEHISRIYNYHVYGTNYKINADSFEILNLLNKESHLQNQRFKVAILAALLAAFLLKLDKFDNNDDVYSMNNHHYHLFNAFRTNVENSFQQNRNAKYYAEKLNITYKHLNDICKEFSNRPAKEFIDDFVILEAKRQLSSTPVTIKEVAFQCGFDEVTNFQKYFKNLTHETPSDFKKKFT